MNKIIKSKKKLSTVMYVMHIFFVQVLMKDIVKARNIKQMYITTKIILLFQKEQNIVIFVIKHLKGFGI